MEDADCYNRVEFLIKKVDDLKQELQEVETKLDNAIGNFELEPLVHELELDIQNVRRKLIYFSERLQIKSQ